MISQDVSFTSDLNNSSFLFNDSLTSGVKRRHTEALPAPSVTFARQEGLVEDVSTPPSAKRGRFEHAPPLSEGLAEE